MVMHFLLIIHKSCRSKTNLYASSKENSVQFKSFPCIIYGDIPKNPLSELYEKDNSCLRVVIVIHL